ncbi:hypothetical protein [Streptomyces sp. NBC_01618]|uniref:hypothetical protein n=1 Tax=Streptomyces sp. NBC_01618 TaxID=2975900 RepID=UPI003867AF6E
MRQSLERGADEQFFGGGEQNGSFSHRDKTVYVAKNTNWNEGGYNNSQPNDGYGCGYKNLPETAKGFQDHNAQLGLWTRTASTSSASR